MSNITLIQNLGFPIALTLILISILVNFMKQITFQFRQEREELMKIINNHLEHHTEVLHRISENLKQTNEEHKQMIELLIKIAERVKKD